MRENELFCRSMVFIAILSVLTLGLFVSTPREVSAYPDLSTDGTCIECHPGGEHEPTTPAKPTEPEEPAEPTEPTEPTEPEEPAEPTEEESSNPLLMVGLVIAALTIGGAIWMDKRRK